MTDRAGREGPFTEPVIGISDENILADLNKFVFYWLKANEWGTPEFVNDLLGVQKAQQDLISTMKIKFDQAMEALTASEMIKNQAEKDRDAARDEVKELKKKEAVLYDIHHALGIVWGEDPYAVIDALRSEVERFRKALEEIAALKENHGWGFKCVDLAKKAISGENPHGGKGE